MSNRLARSASPYLLQHGDNPVEWYPWGDEAFERARREDRPVLLSIGYASCHWCHVMARESFEDESVAALMNDRFVSVKVDREERPDIDAVYMSAVQAMTGSGGWPLTVALTPDGAPFFGGTYFPPEDRWGQPSFRRVLEAISSAWRERRDEVLEAARSQRERLSALQGSLQAAARPSSGPRESAGSRALAALASSFDHEHGGFGRAPKFPPHGALRFLLGRPEPEALAMATATLDAMAAGGIHDQLGGGFARYSVDEGWRVPHFEKMLYDNGQLLQAYAAAYARTRDRRYPPVCAGIVRWLGRELAAPDGGFYSSLDADSDGSEGRYYTWTEEELAAAAGDDAPLAARVYGVRSPGPFEGRNVLRVSEPAEDAARAFGLEPAEAEARLRRARRALLTARERRRRPALDDKILTSWNGLALAGLAEAAGVLESEEALAAAHGIVRRLRARAWRDGRLLHAQRGDVAHVEGLLEDYAYLGLGLLALHRLTLDRALLGWALDLAAVVRRDFQHPDGGFYSASTRAEPLLVRPRSLTDASVPSDNAAAAELLATLAAVTGDGELASAAERAVAPLEDAAARQPRAFASVLSALERLRAPPLEVVLVGDPGRDDTAALVAAWRRRAAGPASAILVGGPSDPLALRCPVARGRVALGGKATAYVCRAGACRLPVTDVPAFESELAAAGIGPGSWPREPGAAS